MGKRMTFFLMNKDVFILGLLLLNLQFFNFKTSKAYSFNSFFQFVSNFMSLKTLPLGFAEQVLELQVNLQDEQSLELIQILSKMYRIAVEYYINNDVSKANFFQRKLNNLAVKSLNCVSVQSQALPRMRSRHEIQEEVHKYQMCQKTYVDEMIKNSKKVQLRIQQHLNQDLRKQEERINGRLLRRVKSSKNL